MSRPRARPTLRLAVLFPAIAILRILAAVSLMLCLAIGPAGAQFFPFGSQVPSLSRPPPPRVPKATQPEAPAPEITTPYDPDLQRLAEILGALHFLRGICGDKEGSKWRDEAQSLIEAETPTGKRHDEMVQSFNRGYLGFQQSYRTCTPAAKVVIRRYLEEGARIARDITARYAN